MAETTRRARLSVDVDLELHHRLEVAAAARGMTKAAYVTRAIERVLAKEGDDAAWSRLSASVFARDWESGEDAVYDEVPTRRGADRPY